MPQNLRLLQGGRSAQPSRNPPGQPKPAAKLPKPPKHLDERERGYWRDFVKRLKVLNVTSEADGGAIELWVKARRRYIDATEHVAQYGMLLKGGTAKAPQVRRNPLLMEIHKAEQVMLRIETEFGLTPSSRTGVREQ